MNPRYPVYVISKGRADTRLTSKALERCRIPYRIVVEPQERDAYAAVIDPAKVLVLPFSNLGQGSIPARNWVWEHSISEGHERHWILDDNISGFYRFNRNLKTPVGDGTVFAAAESFVDRYSNVAKAGFNYFMFVTRKAGNIPPYYLNTRVYSCILLRNDLPHRWRGRYNEDTDLSLRLLKDGHCTVLFNAFLAYKMTTMTMKGGNSDELYQGDGRKAMAQSLVDQHPDVTKITWKWGRWQHDVDYSSFASRRLMLREGLSRPEGVDNFGMRLFVFDGDAEDAARFGGECIDPKELKQRYGYDSEPVTRCDPGVNGLAPVAESSTSTQRQSVLVGDPQTTGSDSTSYTKDCALKNLITIEQFTPRTGVATKYPEFEHGPYRCLLHTKHQTYWVGPETSHANCQGIIADVMEAFGQAAADAIRVATPATAEPERPAAPPLEAPPEPTLKHPERKPATQPQSQPEASAPTAAATKPRGGKYARKAAPAAEKAVTA